MEKTLLFLQVMALRTELDESEDEDMLLYVAIKVKRKKRKEVINGEVGKREQLSLPLEEAMGQARSDIESKSATAEQLLDWPTEKDPIIGFSKLLLVFIHGQHFVQ